MPKVFITIKVWIQDPQREVANVVAVVYSTHNKLTSDSNSSESKSNSLLCLLIVALVVAIIPGHNVY